MADSKHNILLWITSAFMGLYGVGLLVFPGQLNELFGGVTNDSVIIGSRFMGAAVIGLAVLALMARNLTDVESRRTVDATFFAALGLTTLVDLWNIYEFGTTTAVFSWTNVAVELLFTMAFAYYLFGPDMRPAASGARPMR